MNILPGPMIKPGMAKDKSIVDFQTAVAHEVEKHIAVAAKALEGWLSPFETPKATKGECETTCTTFEKLQSLAFKKVYDGFKASKQNY